MFNKNKILSKYKIIKLNLNKYNNLLLLIVD